MNLFFRILAVVALIYAGGVSAAVCFVYHNGALLTAVVAAYFAAEVFATQRAQKDFDRMRDEADKCNALEKR
jgi:hypothetical protein